MNAADNRIPAAILDRDFTADPVRMQMIRSGLIDGVVLGAATMQCSQMAFLLAEVTVCAHELAKIDNDAGTDFLRAIADALDMRRPVSARNRGEEDRAATFKELCRLANQKAVDAGNSDGGVEQ